MIYTIMVKPKVVPLSQRLVEWKKKIAKLLGVESIYQIEAAALLDIPVRTYKNYEPTTRRQPSGLALSELNRRLETVERYLRLKETGDSRLNKVIAKIRAEHTNGELG